MKIPDLTGTKLKLYATAAVVLLLLMVAIGITAFFAGKRDQKDTQAAQDVKALTASLKQATKDLKAQQTGMAEALRLNAEAQNRMSAIGERVATQQLKQEQFAYEIRNTLDAALSARPDLVSVRVGADILCAWNRANAGANSSRSISTATASAPPGCKPDGTVSGSAASKQRRPANAASKSASVR